MHMMSGAGNNRGPLIMRFTPRAVHPLMNQQLDPQLTNALVSLAIIVLGGLGTLVTTVIALIVWLARKVDGNTQLTSQANNNAKDAKEASNGRLREVLDRLAAERDRTVALRAIVREREDRISYLTARLPDAETLMREYRDQRTRHATEAEEIDTEQRVMSNAP